MKANNQNTILVRVETSPEDIHGMHAAVGILTCRGGMTSHAAVVARGMGRACVSGAGNIKIDYANKLFPNIEICNSSNEEKTEHDGIYLVDKTKINEYLKLLRPLKA